MEGAGLAADTAFVADEGEEAGGVCHAIGAGVRGGEHLMVEDGEERDDIGVVDAEDDAVGDEGGEGRIGAIVLGGFGGEVGGAEFPVFGEADFGGVETVLGVVTRGAGLALGGARAGGFARVGAVGGEALFGDGLSRHGYLRRPAADRWRLRARRLRVPRVRSAREARQAGSLWNSFQARTVRREGSTSG